MLEFRDYPQHIETLRQRLPAILSGLPFSGIVLHSGEPHFYFADDQAAPFHTNAHFAHWTPLPGPGHAVIVEPDKQPRLIALIPEDFWYEPVAIGNPAWIGQFDFRAVATEAELLHELGGVAHLAFVGESQGFAARAGFGSMAVNPEVLVHRLNWHRSYKTAYEVECIRQATEMAAAAHRAARDAFYQDASELEVHYAYVRTLRQVDANLPFESIVAMDEKSAYLHYVNKRKSDSGRVLLVDSGAAFQGYASDITRTWTKDTADPVFRQMLNDFCRLEQTLAASVRPGLSFLELHENAHRAIGELLSRVGILRVDGEEAFTRGLTQPFFPHGLGHFLGIQVHDVAGRQLDPDGTMKMPPSHYPYLRTTRVLEPGHVVTIEPGIYFIEMLLRPMRSGSDQDAIDWNLVDRLKHHGGMRIEDNVLVTSDGSTNITRPLLPE
jgi:Xaa-Pro dipeptidase